MLPGIVSLLLTVTGALLYVRLFRRDIDKKNRKRFSFKLKVVGCFLLMVVPILLDLVGYFLISVSTG